MPLRRPRPPWPSYGHGQLFFLTIYYAGDEIDDGGLKIFYSFLKTSSTTKILVVIIDQFVRPISTILNGLPVGLKEILKLAERRRFRT